MAFQKRLEKPSPLVSQARVLGYLGKGCAKRSIPEGEYSFGCPNTMNKCLVFDRYER